MSGIGVWNTAFLGDAVLTLPLLHTLHAAYPEAPIHFHVRKGLEGLFEAQPELASVHGFDKRGRHKGLGAARAYGKAVARQGMDLWISAHASLRSALVARWVSAPVRIGYDRPGWNRFFYTHTVDRAFERFEEIERLLRLVRPLGITNLVTEPRLALPEAAHARAREILDPLRRDGPVLGVHPGSTWPTKMWPIEYFAEILRRAHAAGVRSLILAGPDETDLAAGLLDLAGTPSSAVNLAGTLDLPCLAAVLGGVDAYLTNDSGPMHLAWAQGTQVTAVFGPTTRSLGFFPRGNALVMETDLPCRPCSLHGPRQCPENHHRCMRDVGPETVWASLAGQLGVTT